jgi:hypothetical protein
MLEPKSGKMSFALLPGYNSVPQDIVLDAEGKVWYIDSMRNKIGYFNPNKAKFDEWDIPSTNSQPMQMVLDKSGNVWFSESDRNANKIAKLVATTIPDKGALEQEPAAKAPHGIQGKVGEEEKMDGVSLWTVAIFASIAVILVVFIAVKIRER